MTDEEMIQHYSRLLESLGGQTKGVWTSGIALATESGVCSRSLRSMTVFVAEASSTVVAGHPLRSLQIDPTSGRYLSEMTDQELDSCQGERATGVAVFVRECLGLTDI